MVQDCGLICNKGRGSLEKHPGRTGIFGYGPLDRDLAAQDGSGLDLIWRADSGSGGQGWVGARDGGAGHRSPLLRGGATRGSPDLAKSGRPGVKSTRSRSGVTYRARAVHLGPKRSSGRLGWGSPRRSHGVRGGGAPEHVVPAVRAAHGLINLAQRTAGNEAVLTGGSRRSDAQRSGVDAEVRRRVGAELGGGAGTGVLRALGLPEGSCEVVQGVRGAELAPG